MRCLFCGKEIKKDHINSWHKACIKRFFNSDTLPLVNLKTLDEEMQKLGEKLIEESKSITGVQRKLSMHLDKEKNGTRLTLIGYPQGYILKPNSEQYPFIAEAEHLIMGLANICLIKTTPNALIDIGDNNYAYITKRIDRDDVNKIHMEDFCQLSNRPTEYKYNSSYEKCGKIIKNYSSTSYIDQVELIYRLLFCYIVGNSDMHLKNFSLKETKDGFSLSEAYDLLPVQLIINDNEDMALTLNGKKKNLTKNDFYKLADNLEIPRKTVEKLIIRLFAKKEKMFDYINDSYIPEEKKEELKKLIQKRFDKLI